MFTLPQEIAAALLVKRIGDGAIDAAQKAGEASETLKRIEQQNKETLKRIEAQNSEIHRLKMAEISKPIRIEPQRIEPAQPKIAERKISQASRSSPTPISIMVACSQCGKQTLRSNKRCIICGHLW
jgi:hypothetical protein